MSKPQNGLEKPKLTFIQKCKTMRGQQMVCTVTFLIVPPLLLFIGAIASVDPTLYEAADLDGANAWQRFKCIIVPSIRTIVVLNLILSVSGALSAFEMPYAVTGGTFGTSTYFVLMNKLAHTDMKVGLASAMAVVLLALILVVTLVQKFAEIMMDRAENKPHNYGAKKEAAK